MKYLCILVPFNTVSSSSNPNDVRITCCCSTSSLNCNRLLRLFLLDGETLDGETISRDREESHDITPLDAIFKCVKAYIVH